jgi:subtilisin family serine protease
MLLACPAYADSVRDDEYQLRTLDVTTAWKYSTGAGVTVAVLDTGVDLQDAGVAGAVVAEHCFVPPDGCPDGTAEQDGAGSAQDDQGHGTAMADIIAGNGGTGPIGVAPGASIVAVKVADKNGRTSTPQVVAGLTWLLQHHPEVRVVNVSLGSDVMLSGDCSDLTATFKAYSALVDQLRANGTTVFASSGNGGSCASMTSPACIHNVVAVGAVYSRSFGSFTAPFVCRDDATRVDEIACFSNSSSELDLLAAGAPVSADVLNSFDSPLAGTSAASAQVSGAAAVLLGADPPLTSDDLVGLLENTGVPITDARNGFTRPRIDLAAALGTVIGRPVPLLPTPPDLLPPVAPVLSVPTVPRAKLSTSPISFGSVALRHVGTRTLVVRNGGTGYLTVRVGSSLASVSVLPAKLTIAGAHSGTVTVTFRPQRAGRYRGLLRLQTDDPSAPSITVSLRGSAR